MFKIITKPTTADINYCISKMISISCEYMLITYQKHGKVVSYIGDLSLFFSSPLPFTGFYICNPSDNVR